MKLLSEVIVLLQDGLNIFKQLAIPIETLVALIDGSLELVWDVLLVLLEDHFEASLVSGDYSLALQEEWKQMLLLLSDSLDSFAVLAADVVH